MNDSIPRREFLKKAGAAGLGLSLSTSLLSFAAPAVSPEPRRLRVAVIGTNSRGLAHVEALCGIPGVEVTTICDVDDRAIAKGIAAVKEQQPAGAKSEKDFRKVLADPAIDAVTMATPDHWHAPMAILALAAGKPVYLEKPCSQNPREGELLLEAISKHGGIVQMGNQRRSFPNMLAAIKEIHDGVIGRAYFARAWYTNARPSIGTGSEVPVPPSLDYELWQGPAPRQPYQDNIIPYNWHWFWNWGTGEALNNGTHEVDVCRWALDAGFPSRVISAGGRYAFHDDWQTPDTQTIAWDFPDGKSLAWEGRSCNKFPVEGLERGALIFGTKGAALLEGDNYTAYDAKNNVIRQLESGRGVKDSTNVLSSTGPALDRLHFENFVDAIRNGAPLHSPISEGHKSCTLLHLGNIAWRTNRELHTDPATGHIQNDPGAMKLWSRDYEPGWEPKV